MNSLRSLTHFFPHSTSWKKRFSAECAKSPPSSFRVLRKLSFRMRIIGREGEQNEENTNDINHKDITSFSTHPRVWEQGKKWHDDRKIER